MIVKSLFCSVLLLQTTLIVTGGCKNERNPWLVKEGTIVLDFSILR